MSWAIQSQGVARYHDTGRDAIAAGFVGGASFPRRRCGGSALAGLDGVSAGR